MTAPQLPKLESSKLRESAYLALREAFTRGEFAPGDVLNLRGLAAQLGTSMTPVREAVRRLVAEGALIDTPSRTLMVPPFDAARMRDLRRTRLALEPLLLEGAFPRIDDALVARLREILASAEGPADRPDLAQNHAFHFAIYRAAEAPVLLPLVSGLWLQYGSYLNVIMRASTEQIGDGNDYHADLVAALADRDLEAARAALIGDIERGFSLVAAAARI